MRTALRAEDEQSWKDRKAEHHARIRKEKGRKFNKTFEQLAPEEKDKLLKILAVRAGLILDSDD
jgi:hypothetical protein